MNLPLISFFKCHTDRWNQSLTCQYYHQYHGCWWPDDIRNQGMSRQGTVLVPMKYFLAHIARVHIDFNPSPPSAAYMRRWTGSALVQVMACRLFGAKPLLEPMLAYCQLDSWEQILVKFKSEFYHFHSRKYIWMCRLPKCGPLCPGGDELSFLY